MNKVINTIAAIFALTLMATPALSGESKAPVVAVQPVDSSFGLTAKLFAVSVIEDTDNIVYGGGLSLEVPIFDSLSLEVGGSIFEDEVYAINANALYYFDVADNLSLYVVGGGSYDIESEAFFVGGGAGVKYALSKQLSLFSDGIYNWNTDEDYDSGVVTVRVGVGFSF